MEVIHDWINHSFYVEEKIDNQTFRMEFENVGETLDTIYFNIAVSVYNKRKHQDANEQLIKITGKNPMATAMMAIKAFKMLEKSCNEYYNKNYNTFFYACWIDNRRRQVYEKFLTKFGYNYGSSPFGEKCLFKKYVKGEAQ